MVTPAFGTTEYFAERLRSHDDPRDFNSVLLASIEGCARSCDSDAASMTHIRNALAAAQLVRAERSNA